MRIDATISGLRGFIDGLKADFDKAEKSAMRSAADGLKGDLRSQTEVVLGRKVATTWRGNFYPNPDSDAGPAAFVYSRAPNIILFNSANQVVRARNGRFLAIATEDTPRKPGGSHMSVEEAEEKYGRRLQLIVPNDRGFRTPSVKRAGIGYLVLKNLVPVGRTQRWRNATERDRKRGRQTSAVILFILLPFVRGKRLIDLDAIANDWGDRAASLIADRIGALA